MPLSVESASTALLPLAPAEFDKWKSLLQTVTDDWVKKLEQKGYDGRKLLDDLQGMIKQASS